MTTSEIGILIAIIVYMVGVVGIGVYFAKKNSTTNDFYFEVNLFTTSGTISIILDNPS